MATIKLSLAEQGWVEIDDKARRVHGDIGKIVQEMQNTLESSEVVSLCSRLGICSAGFMFLDRFTRMTRFFNIDDLKPSLTYGTPYISISKTIQEELFEEIHVLFVRIRQRQEGWMNKSDALVPEYLRYLPSMDYWVFDEERKLRNEFGIHYCSYGEMIVTTFLWRALTAACASGHGHEEVQKVLPLNLDSEVNIHSELQLRWSGENLLEEVSRLNVLHRGRSQSLLTEEWQKEFGSGRTWRDEWRPLRLIHHEQAYSEVSRLAGLRFCQAVMRDTTESFKTQDESINRVFSEALEPLLKSLGCSADVKTVNQALLYLECYARFPIPPFYVWNALETDPKVYCVVPVWSSQGYPLERNDREYHHFGLALTALRPMGEIDWTWPFDCACAESHQPLKTNPLIVTNLLRLMSRPLVEHSLYGPLVEAAVKEAMERTNESFDKASKAIIENHSRDGKKQMG